MLTRYTSSETSTYVLIEPDDPVSRQFTDTLATHGLTCRVTTPTHDRGGLLDIVATRDDVPAPSVEVVDIGLSDHRLQRWTVSLVRPSPEYTTRKCRPWRLLDTDDFCAACRSPVVVTVSSRRVEGPGRRRTC